MPEWRDAGMPRWRDGGMPEPFHDFIFTAGNQLAHSAGGFCCMRPILYTFEKKQVLLWLVEFQEDKWRFSIYRLLRYVTDLMEQYPDALMIPMVLFTIITIIPIRLWRFIRSRVT